MPSGKGLDVYRSSDLCFSVFSLLLLSSNLANVLPFSSIFHCPLDVYKLFIPILNFLKLFTVYTTVLVFYPSWIYF